MATGIRCSHADSCSGGRMLEPAPRGTGASRWLASDTKFIHEKHNDVNVIFQQTIMVSSIPLHSYCAGAQRRRFLFRIWSLKRSRVYPSGVRCVYGKNGQNTEWYLRRLQCQIPFGLFFSRFSRCRRKLNFRGKGMICLDPKKSRFFKVSIISIIFRPM